MMCLLTRINMPHMRRTGGTVKYPPILLVHQYRLLPFGFLHCIPHGKPARHLLMLQGTTPVHKGLAPSGTRPLYLYSLNEVKINTHKLLVKRKNICIFPISKQLPQVCTATHAGHTHCIKCIKTHFILTVVIN